MIVPTLIVALATGLQASVKAAAPWETYVSRDGKFVIDLPGKPTKTYTRTSRSRRGQVNVIVVRCDTPDVTYVAEKIEIPGGGTLKANEAEALLDYWRDDFANDYNGKVTTQKRLRLDTGAYGRDFTIEGRPLAKEGLATIRTREYLTARVLYILAAASAPDRELPDDVGHFFASFAVGTTRTKKVGPHPELAGKPLGSWGNLIDPDGDCTVKDLGKTLEIAVPNTHHDLNADNDKLNAPRVVREVTGDFGITVKIDGNFKPSGKSTNPKAVPYEGAGILAWQDSDNYIFLGRAAINRNGKISEFAAFEEREWGTRGALNNRGLKPGPVYLRLERRGNKYLGGTSEDGKNWSRLEPMETSYPSAIKVGIYAINGCTEPFSTRFEDFSLTEGKGGRQPAKPKVDERRIGLRAGSAAVSGDAG